MKVLVLDGRPQKKDEIRDAFSKKKLEAVVCVSSNDFLTAMNSTKFETACINAEAWGKGRVIYDYFGIGQRLEEKQVVFYNAEANVIAIANRKPYGKDIVLCKPSDVEEIVGAI